MEGGRERDEVSVGGVSCGKERKRVVPFLKWKEDLW